MNVLDNPQIIERFGTKFTEEARYETDAGVTVSYFAAEGHAPYVIADSAGHIIEGPQPTIYRAAQAVIETTKELHAHITAATGPRPGEPNQAVPDQPLQPVPRGGPAELGESGA